MEELTWTSIFCEDGLRFGHSCGGRGKVEMEDSTMWGVVKVEVEMEWEEERAGNERGSGSKRAEDRWESPQWCQGHVGRRVS